MNILEISTAVKNHCLDKAYGDGTIYLSIPSMTQQGDANLPHAQASFTISNGMATLTNPVQFAVPAGTIVDKVYISNVTLSNDSASNLSDRIELEGEEIVEFTTSGIYLISAINITLTERNDWYGSFKNKQSKKINSKWFEW